MNRESVTCVCVCSCDAYQDIWPYFFYFLNKNWKDCCYPIIFNTETKNCKIDGNKIQTVNSNKKNITWSQRLKECLSSIPYENVIIILDDFFILSQVRADVIEECEQALLKYKDIACFNFRQKRQDEIESAQFPGFCQRQVKNTYWVNLLPAIWNKRALINLLSKYENAWQLEFYGTERAKLSKWKFFELSDEVKPVFDFNISITDGYGLCQGKWTKPTVDLFNKEGIDADFSKRGFCNPSKINTTVEYPRMEFRHRLLYFFHGGLALEDISANKGKFRMSFGEQFLLLLQHPRLWCKILKNKLKILLQRNVGHFVDSETGKLV